MVAAIQSLLDARIGFRMPIVVAGAMLGRSRHVSSTWFRAVGVKDDWDRFYELLVSLLTVLPSDLAITPKSQTFIITPRLVQSIANGWMVIMGMLGCAGDASSVGHDRFATPLDVRQCDIAASDAKYGWELGTIVVQCDSRMLGFGASQEAVQRSIHITHSVAKVGYRIEMFICSNAVLDRFDKAFRLHVIPVMPYPLAGNETTHEAIVFGDYDYERAK